jgi:hypothetical protein
VSGNGAHALYRWRAAVTAETVEMLAALYRGLKIDFGSDRVEFDTTVRNPARIWRLYGTTNRKGEPTAERPHRQASVVIPPRWEAVSPQQVERMASAYANRRSPDVGQRPQPTQLVRVRGEGDYATLDVVSWFKAHGAYRRHLDADKHAVRCPWGYEHSTVDPEHSTATVIWETRGQLWPNFRCLHSHCDGRGIRDVMALWGDADRYCSRSWRTAG